MAASESSQPAWLIKFNRILRGSTVLFANGYIRAEARNFGRYEALKKAYLKYFEFLRSLTPQEREDFELWRKPTTTKKAESRRMTNDEFIQYYEDRSRMWIEKYDRGETKGSEIDRERLKNTILILARSDVAFREELKGLLLKPIPTYDSVVGTLKCSDDPMSVIFSSDE